jgi:hypothetical protein
MDKIVFGRENTIFDADCICDLISVVNNKKGFIVDVSNCECIDLGTFGAGNMHYLISRGKFSVKK